ncbi:hypothetical protein AWENTII_006587 [Aspergillus wentii]
MTVRQEESIARPSINMHTSIASSNDIHNASFKTRDINKRNINQRLVRESKSQSGQRDTQKFSAWGEVLHIVSVPSRPRTIPWCCLGLLGYLDILLFNLDDDEEDDDIGLKMSIEDDPEDQHVKPHGRHRDPTGKRFNSLRSDRLFLG